MTKEFLEPKDVAEELQIHIITVLRWIRKGTLPAVKQGVGPAARYRIERGDLDKLVKQIYPFLKKDARYSKNQKGK